MKKLNELFSLNNQVKAVRLQNKLGKHNFHEDMKKVYETMTDIMKDFSEDITESSIKMNRAFSDLNGKVLELLKDKCMIAPFFTSRLITFL